MLPGLAHSHSAGEGRLRKLIVRFLSAYAEGETERPPPNTLTLTIGRGQKGSDVFSAVAGRGPPGTPYVSLP